MLTECN